MTRPILAALASLWLISATLAQDVINPQTNATQLTTGTLPSARISGSYTGITGTGALAAGSLASGFTAVGPALGGTGIANNAASTLTISGSFASTFVVSGAFSYTFPGASATLAALASPTFTGTPAAPTAAISTNTTQLASTAFVIAQFAAPGAIGGTTPSTGAFTTLKTGTTVTPLVAGTGLDIYIADIPIATGTGGLNVYTTDAIALNKGGSLGLGGKGGGSVYPFAVIAGRSENNSYAGYFQVSTVASAGTVTEWLRVNSSGVLSLSATVDATSVSTGTITNPGGMSVNKRVWMDGLSTATGTPSSICRNANEVTVNAALTCTVSSLIFKHDFTPIVEPALPKLMAMDPGSFYYNDNGDRQRLGFAAEYMQRLDPRLADGYDADGHARSIDQNAILAVTVKAVQELAAEVRQLRAR